MSKASQRQRLRDALHEADSDWILSFWGKEQDKNLDRVLGDLDQFADEYAKRFRERPDPFKLLAENPLKGAAFFQIDTLRLSAEMKVMVWRILLGCEITRVEFRYAAGRKPTLRVTLRPPYGQGEEEYTGGEPTDFRILRHFGSSGADDQLFLEGYYALRVR